MLERRSGESLPPFDHVSRVASFSAENGSDSRYPSKLIGAAGR